MIKCFFPYLIYFLLTLLFLTNFTSVGIHSYSDNEQTIAGIMGILIIILNIYFLFFEFAGMMRNATTFFTEDLFNYIDLLSSVLNAGLVFVTLLEKESDATSDRTTIRNFTVIAVLLMWTNSLDWLNMLPLYSFYWRVIKATLSEVTKIVLVFLLLLGAIGNALLILNEGRYADNKLYGEFFSSDFLNAMMN